MLSIQARLTLLRINIKIMNTHSQTVTYLKYTFTNIFNFIFRTMRNVFVFQLRVAVSWRLYRGQDVYKFTQRIGQMGHFFQIFINSCGTGYTNAGIVSSCLQA